MGVKPILWISPSPSSLRTPRVNGWTPRASPAFSRVMGSPDSASSSLISRGEKSLSVFGTRRVLKNSEPRTTVSSFCMANIRGVSFSSPEIASATDGHCFAAKHTGQTLRDVSFTSLPRTRMRLSPPIPEVDISAAMTLVRVPPMVAPSGSSLGLPSRRIPMSVVVPPMSMTMASFMPVMRMAPMRLAAGPDITVSTGFLLASASPIMEPSPRTIIRGATMPYSDMTFFTDSIRSAITGIRRAFITQVTALSLNPSPEDRS